MRCCSSAEPREYRDADGEALTERVLGFPVPIDGLAEWVQGKPAPKLEAAAGKSSIRSATRKGARRACV